MIVFKFKHRTIIASTNLPFQKQFVVQLSAVDKISTVIERYTIPLQ